MTLRGSSRAIPVSRGASNRHHRPSLRCHCRPPGLRPAGAASAANALHRHPFAPEGAPTKGMRPAPVGAASAANALHRHPFAPEGAPTKGMRPAPVGAVSAANARYRHPFAPGGAPTQPHLRTAPVGAASAANALHRHPFAPDGAPTRAMRPAPVGAASAANHHVAKSSKSLAPEGAPPRRRSSLRPNRQARAPAGRITDVKIRRENRL
jgi:hypothetical protein